MPYLNRGESRLYHEIHGEGPDVVLLHGVGGNHASWFHQFHAWRTRFRMIAIDARGFGNSTDAEGSGRSAFVDDLLHVLDALGVARAHLVAQSMGGGTAALFACRHPARVASLTLADTLVGVELPAAIAERMAEVTKAGLALTQIQRVLGPTFQKAQPAMAELYLALASFNSVDIRTVPGSFDRYTPQMLAQTGVRTLYVVGSEDVLFPPFAVHAVHRAVAGSAYAELSPAGHSAYFEQPDRFNALVGQWIESEPVRH